MPNGDTWICALKLVVQIKAVLDCSGLPKDIATIWHKCQVLALPPKLKQHNLTISRAHVGTGKHAQHLCQSVSQESGVGVNCNLPRLAKGTSGAFGCFLDFTFSEFLYILSYAVSFQKVISYKGISDVLDFLWALIPFSTSWI